MSRFYRTVKIILLYFVFSQALLLKSQGNRLSVQITPPRNLSICGLNDTAAFEVYNISSGTVTGISIRINLPSGINYIRGSVKGGSIAESNVSNLNQPVFSAPNLSLASNFKFSFRLTADCDLLTFLNNSNTPVISSRVDYTGNYDNGSSIPFSVSVPSLQFNSISNLTYTGDLGSKFSRTISFGNYGKGPLKEVVVRRISGKDVSVYMVLGGQSSFSFDTVYTRFGANYFKTIGNKDTFLDQNEIISFSDSILIKGCKNLNTQFDLMWGCNGKYCQISRNSGAVIISSRSPVLAAIPKPTYPTCYNNKSFRSELWLVNKGDMNAVAPRVEISQLYPYMYSAFDTSSIRIRVGSRSVWQRVAKDSVSDSYNQGYYGCIGLYPIGYFRLKLPDIKPGDTVFVRWDANSCLPPDCSNANIVINSWGYAADYKDQCLNLKTIGWTWGKVYDQQYFSATNFIPTDLINNQIGEFRTYISSASLLNVSSGARYKVELILPKGLTHSMQKKDFYFMSPDLSSSWSPDSLRMHGDTLRVFFPHPVPFNLSGSELIYYLKADCSVSGANGNQTIQMFIRYNPDPSCSPAEWISLNCQTLQLKIHCFSNCPGGMRFRNFSVKRINFGRPDNNNDGKPDSSGSLDTLNVREERCMTGDTIESIFTGIAKRTSSVISWRYAYIESRIANGSYLEVAGVNMKVWRRGNSLSVNCNQVRYFKTTNGADATFKIDLSTDSLLNCVSSSFRYNTDDSIEIRVRYRVARNPYGLILNLNFNNLFYTSTVGNPTSSSNRFQCDTFSGQMIMSGYYFATCCSETFQSVSCNQLGVNNYYYLGLGACCNNYGGNNYFPFEYRHFGRLKQVKYYVPAGFKYVYSQLGQYRTAGSGKTAFEYKDSLKAQSTSGNPIVYDVSNYYTDSAGGKIVPSDDGFHGYYYALIEPTCSAVQGNIYSRYDFIFERMGTLAPGYDTITSGYTEAIAYSEPVYKISPASQTIYAAKDTAEWELIFSNYSTTFTNNNAWLSPDNSGAIKVVEIKDVATGQKLPVSNGIYKIGSVTYSSTRRFIVRAIYNSCKRDSVVIYTGWNCQDYPKDISSYSCRKEKAVLYLEPQNTQFQVSLSDSVNVGDLCAGIPYKMLIENTGATVAYNTRAILNLPIGMSVISGSSYVRYPGNGTKIAIANPTLKSGTTYEWNLSSLNSTIAKGFKGVSDTGANKIFIEFKIKTDCNYSSGNYIRASAAGSIRCGDPVLVYPAISNPFNIKGVTRPYYTLLKVSSDSVFPCEKPSEVRVTLINLGPGNTGFEDKYQVILPPGLIYDSLKYVKVRKAPEDTSIVSRSFNGATEVEFGLPSGIVPGDSIQFEYGFNADNTKLDCGPVDLYSQTAVKQEVVCVADMSKCKINVVTGNNLQKPTVVKGSFVFGNPAVSQLVNVNDSEEVNLAFTIRNNGFRSISSKLFKYKIVYDVNYSGTPDAKDKVLYSDTLVRNFSSGATIKINKKFRFNAGSSCALFIWLDSSSCSCDFSYLKFPVPALQNAGPDVTLCSGDTVSIGQKSVKGYAYKWAPASEFVNDTLSSIKKTYINNDTAGIRKQFVLTTYRGFCTSNDTVWVDVFKQPVVGIRQEDTGICENERVLLKAVSRGGTGVHKFSWTPSSQLQTPSLSNTYTVNKVSQTFKVEVTDVKNCKAFDTVRVNVNAKPVNNFTYSSVCDGDSVTLTDSTILSGDTIRFRKWTYLNYDTTHAVKLKVNPLGAMVFDVRYYTVSSHGCSDTLIKKVYLNPLPQAIFKPVNICSKDTLNLFSSSKVVTGKISENDWFVDGVKISSGNSFKSRFLNSDTLEVTLLSRTDKNCLDSITHGVLVYDLPVADFNVGDVCSGDTVHAFDLSTIQKGLISSHVWKTGSVAKDTVSFSYFNLKDTTYLLSLVVSSEHGCKDTMTQTFDVYPNPVSRFQTDTVCEKSASYFKSQSSISKGNIVSYSYTLSDGSQYATPDFSHQFSDSGNYAVRLITFSNKGCRDTVLENARVYPAITPDFFINDTCLGDWSVIKDNSDYSKVTAKRIVYYFTPADSSSDPNPLFRYATPGKKTIKQMVVTQEGCGYNSTHDLEIHPLPSAIMKDSNNCFDNRFSFSSESVISKGSVASNVWYFGDNTSTTGNYVVHDFPLTGTYQVTLVAVSDRQCKDSVSKNVTAFPKVVPDFTYNDVCLGYLTNFRDKSFVSNASITSYRWDFGDASQSLQQNPDHRYYASGVYKVNLRIKTSYNCEYDTNKSVSVYPVPVADFSLSPEKSDILSPDISISDNSTGADVIQYDLGNGQTTNSRNLIETYPDSGWYIIRQYASNQYGCADSVFKKLYIDYLFKFYAPTSFSPNNDGYNDTYSPDGIGIRSYEMSIYNRWGELIYQDLNSGKWDGRYGDQMVMDGVYLVRFRVRDYKGRWHSVSTTVNLLK